MPSIQKARLDRIKMDTIPAWICSRKECQRRLKRTSEVASLRIEKNYRLKFIVNAAGNNSYHSNSLSICLTLLPWWELLDIARFFALQSSWLWINQNFCRSFITTSRALFSPIWISFVFVAFFCLMLQSAVPKWHIFWHISRISCMKALASMAL